MSTRISSKVSFGGWKQLLINCLVGVLLGAILIAGYQLFFGRSNTDSPSRAEPSGLQVGQPAPDFKLKDLNGQTISLSQFKGHPLWINFWAASCTPCVEEMPTVNAERKKARQDGVRFLAIDVGETDQAVRSFLQENGYTGLPVAMDQTGKVISKYRITRIPTHVFIDSSGTVRKVVTDKLDESKIQDYLRSINQ